MKFKRPNDYTSFKKNLKRDFIDPNGDLNIETIQELSSEMQKGRYHSTRDKETRTFTDEAPTQKQLDFAWDFLQKEAKPFQKLLDDFFSKEIYNGRDSFRLTTNERIINGKRYRKGQFIPKQN